MDAFEKLARGNSPDEEDTMVTEKAIIEFGSKGVLLYREISHIVDDNALPEVFLGGFIASKLYHQFQCPIHIERYYTTMAKELGMEITPDLLTELGGLRADVSMYKGELPSAIIELKIYDERRQPTSIADDLRKVGKLAHNGGVRAYVGVMICETASASLKIRTSGLENALARKFLTGDPQKSVDGQWSWCFGCARL